MVTSGDARQDPSGLSIGSVSRVDELASEGLDGLSAYFSPFLRHFVEETLRIGGEVRVARSPSRLEGLFLRHEGERVGSIFARNPVAAEALYRTRGEVSVYCEQLLDRDAAVLAVYALEMEGGPPEHRFVHPVRSARREDGPAILRVMQEVYGSVDDRWLRAEPHPRELAFVAEIGDRLCGVAWVTVVGRHARLHSLSVAPRYRGLGVGADLWHARVLAAHAAGADHVLTEIAESNTASHSIAVAGGMRRIGQVYENRR